MGRLRWGRPIRSGWRGRTPQAYQAYVKKWFDRTKDLIDTYNPDLLYFDDAMAPLGDAGLNIFAHYYDANLRRHHGKLEAVLNTKNMPKELLEDPRSRPRVAEARNRNFIPGRRTPASAIGTTPRAYIIAPPA